jgi:LysR family transcriptional regulator, cell division regulator
MQFVPLMEEQLVLVASPEIQEQMRTRGAEVLKDSWLIGYGGRCLYQAMAEDVWKRLGLGECKKLEYASMDMIKQSAAFGLGAALVPESAVRTELADGTLAQLAMESSLAVAHGLIQLRGKQLTGAAQALREAIEHHFISSQTTARMPAHKTVPNNSPNAMPRAAER